jgi:hypothetical protein
MTVATPSQSDALFGGAIGALEVESTNIGDRLDCYRPPDPEELRLPSVHGPSGWPIWHEPRSEQERA